MEEGEASFAPPKGHIFLGKRAWDRESNCDCTPWKPWPQTSLRRPITPVNTEAQKLGSGKLNARSRAVLIGGLWEQCLEESRWERGSSEPPNHQVKSPLVGKDPDDGED